MQDEAFTNYRRIPIQASRTSYMIIHMFEYAPDHIEDIMQPDELHSKMCDVDFNESADQFFKQLEGDDCVAFIKAMRDKCNELLIGVDERQAEVRKMIEKRREEIELDEIK
jgi:hypothetical protein